MNYLVDTSALVRIIRGHVDAHWDDLVERGLLALCEPVLIEARAIADAKSYGKVENEIRATYPWDRHPDFETASRIVPQLRQERLTAGL